jgi:hypothetical protein
LLPTPSPGLVKQATSVHDRPSCARCSTSKESGDRARFGGSGRLIRRRSVSSWAAPNANASSYSRPRVGVTSFGRQGRR